MPFRQKNTSRSFNSKPGKKGLYYGWIIVGALFLIGMAGLGIARFSFGVFFESLQDNFGWSRASTSGVFSAYMCFSLLVTILGGWAVDRYGPRKVFTALGFFTGLGLLLTSRVTAPWHLFLTYSLLLAMGTGCIYVASMATIFRWFTQRRGLALGIASCGAGIGMMVMSPIAAYFISSYGWQTSYSIMALMAFLIMIPCALLLRSPPGEAAALPDGGRSGNSTKGLSLAQAAKTRNFWLQLFILFLFSTCIFSVNTHIVLHAHDLGIGSMPAALLLSYIGGGSILGRIILGRISDSIGRKQAFLICALLLMGTMLWLTESSDLWMLYICTAVFGFSFGGTAPVNAALIGEYFGARHLGLIMAVIDIGWQAGAALGSILTGHTFDISGGYIPAFRAGAIVALIAAILTLFLRTPTSYNQASHE